MPPRQAPLPAAPKAPLPAAPKAPPPAALSADLAEVAPAAKRPRVGGDCASAPALKPTLPAEGTDQPAREVMQTVVPWVHAELPSVLRDMGLLKQDEDLFATKPLDIATSSAGDVSSYKEAWKPANCVLSCNQSGFYEAGGSGLWIDPEVTHEGTLPFADCGWDALVQAGTTQFVPGEHNGVERIRYPVTMSCWWRSGVLGLPKDGFPSGMVPLGGKPFLWAWYLEMFRAIDKDDQARIKKLYECISTVTILMFTTDNQEKVCEESMKMSETVRINKKVVSDSFVTFARKVLMLGKDLSVKDTVQRDIRFLGGQYNATMAQTIKLMQSSLMTPGNLKKLQDLDRSHGQDVLTGSYNKIKAFLSTTKNDPINCAWVLDQMSVALDRKEVNTGDFLLTAYQKQRNGNPNFVQGALATKLMVEHCDTIVQGLHAVDETSSNALREHVFSKLCTPRLYHTQFPIETEAAEGDEEGSGVPAKDDFMEGLSNKVAKSGILLAELLKKIFEGEYQDASTAIATAENPTSVLHAMDEQTLGVFAKDIAELLKALHASDAVVSVSSGAAAPKATLRELVRATSDGGDREQAAAERQDIWKRAVANRKKLVSLVQVQNPKAKTSYMDALTKCSSVTGFRGKAGESHRVFVLSCDLLTQKGKVPWMTASAPDDKILEEMIEFLTTHGRGESDVIMVWDGCNRKTRRPLEDHLMKLDTCTEVFVVYSSSWNGWVKKKYHLSSENTECGYLAFGRQKSRTGCKDRKADFCAAGETNSHFTTFTGVGLPGRSTLSKISASDKEKVFPEPTDPLPKKWVDNVPVGVPMFWGETKSMVTWTQLLDEVQGHCVVDVSCGSGVLASACMMRGTPYAGLVGNPHHLTWLTNVVDRNSCKFMCTTGNFLYQEDLATLLGELFADVVDPKEDTTAEEAIQQPDE